MRNGGAEPSPHYEPLAESETMSIRETIGVVLFLVVSDVRRSHSPSPKPRRRHLMRRTRSLVIAATLVMPLVLFAQEGGVTADGWEARLDRGGDAASVLSFMTMGSGVHATTASAGAAIFWQPSSMTKGSYTISASFTQAEPSNHPNAYGLFFGGSDLAGANQRYSYFVIP